MVSLPARNTHRLAEWTSQPTTTLSLSQPLAITHPAFRFPTARGMAALSLPWRHGRGGHGHAEVARRRDRRQVQGALLQRGGSAVGRARLLAGVVNDLLCSRLTVSASHHGLGQEGACAGRSRELRRWWTRESLTPPPCMGRLQRIEESVQWLLRGSVDLFHKGDRSPQPKS